MARGRASGPSMFQFLRGFALITALVLNSGFAFAEDLSKQVLMRKDLQRITGNAKLERQFETDRAACIALAQQSQPYESLRFGGCMSEKGYIMVPRDEAESRLAAAAASHTAAQKQQKTKSSSDGQMIGERGDRNEANRRLLALSEKDRRNLFAIQLGMSGEACGEVTRTFYKGSAKPSWNAIWNVECKGGPSYSIVIMSDEKGSSKVLTCGELRAAGGGECFVRN
jgi:hypothetical protein